MKKKEQIEKLMKHIEEKLNHSTLQKPSQNVKNFNKLSVNDVRGA